MGRCENRHRSFLSPIQISIRSSVQIEKEPRNPHQEPSIRDYSVVNHSPADTGLACQGYVTEQYLEGVHILHGKRLYSFARPDSEMSPLRQGKPWKRRKNTNFVP